MGGEGDVPRGAVDGEWGGPDRDLGAAASRTRLPLRNSELPSTLMRHHVLM